jgi:hypothetical protein
LPGPVGGGQPAAAELESPSLFAAGTDGPPAFELKFLLTEPQAREVEARVKGALALDPHADPALGNAYLTTSLYTDTPGFDVLRRTGALGPRKYRVRRYGVAGPVFLERKTKTGDRVRKRRSEVEPGDVPHLAGVEVPADWAGVWYHRQVIKRNLHPVCRIAYERVAYMGATDAGAVRVTFDRKVRGTSANSWEVAPVGAAGDLLAGRVVGEFKFRVALPTLLKQIVIDLNLTPGTVSKYRLFMDTVHPPHPHAHGGHVTDG